LSDQHLGTQLGGYEIESLLGRGGMGVVYKARHLRLGRMVALKILAPELAADDNFRTRFVRESQMAASIDHPNVIPVYDADEIDGTLFIAMRYVDGTDLKKVIEADGALTPERTLTVISAMAGALDAAHALGLIHRDVKPANVLVGRTETTPEQIYLTDFGLTKHSGSKSGLTATGAFVGTIDYIAPEQIEGKTVGTQADIYALGCVLFECLTGSVPFEKEADVAVMYAHLMDDRPKATDKNASLPAAVDAVLAKAMAREPEARYGSGAELVDDLGSALGGGAAAPVAVATPPPAPVEPKAPEIRVEVPPEPAGAPAARRISPKMAAVALGAVILVAGVAFFMTRDGDDVKETEPTSGSGIPADAVLVEPGGDLRAAVAKAGEGGTVILADGFYESKKVPMVTIKQSVTIMGAEGAAPVLRGNDRFPDGIRIAAGTSDVTVSNLIFDNFNGEALKVFCFTCEDGIENQNITFENLEFRSGGSPIKVENVSGLSLEGVTVQENDFVGLLCDPGPCEDVTIKNSMFQSGVQPGSAGVLIESGLNVLIEDSDASFNGGSGFVSSAANTQIVRSTATNNRFDGADLYGANSEIRDSIVADNRTGAVEMGEGDCKRSCAGGVFTIVNTLMEGNGSGIFVSGDSGGTQFQMFNSILTDNRNDAVNVAGAVKLIRIDHNLIHSVGYPALIYKGKKYTSESINNLPINTDETYGYAPVFVAPDDYHLTPESDGVDAGTQEGVQSTVDLDGNPRMQGDEADIGPYEQ